MLDFSKYFMDGYDYTLDEIKFERIDGEQGKTGGVLKCSDTIVTKLLDDLHLKILFSRSLFFEPRALFELSVQYSGVFTLNSNTKGEVDWENLNFTEEIRETYPEFLNNFVARAALQIAQITSSFGQQPIITPPVPIINLASDKI